MHNGSLTSFYSPTRRFGPSYNPAQGNKQGCGSVPVVMMSNCMHNWEEAFKFIENRLGWHPQAPCSLDIWRWTWLYIIISEEHVCPHASLLYHQISDGCPPSVLCKPAFSRIHEQISTSEMQSILRASSKSCRGQKELWVCPHSEKIQLLLVLPVQVYLRDIMQCCAEIPELV